MKEAQNIRYKKMHSVPGFIIRVMDRIGYLLFKSPNRTIKNQVMKIFKKKFSRDAGWKSLNSAFLKAK